MFASWRSHTVFRLCPYAPFSSESMGLSAPRHMMWMLVMMEMMKKQMMRRKKDDGGSCYFP